MNKTYEVIINNVKQPFYLKANNTWDAYQLFDDEWKKIYPNTVPPFKSNVKLMEIKDDK